MPMYKKGDGSTGHIVETASGDDKSVCLGCGHLFREDDLTEGKCGACSDPSVDTAEASSCCGGKCTED